METKTEFLVGTIMSAVATAGVAVTAIVSAEDTKRAMRKLEAAQKEKGSSLTKKETFKAVWKCYIPTAITVVLTAGLCFGSNLVNKDAAGKVKATAASLLGVAGTKLSEAKEKLFEKRVEEQKEIVEKEPDDGQVLFYMDEMGGFFHADPLDVVNATQKANRQYATYGLAKLGDMLEEFHADQPIPDESYTMGWSYDYIMENDGWGLDDCNYTTIISPKYYLVNLDPNAETIDRIDVLRAAGQEKGLFEIPKIPKQPGLYCIVIEYPWALEPISYADIIAFSNDSDKDECEQFLCVTK